MNKVAEYFQNKRVLILGYGREGKSTHNLLIKNDVSCETFIYDIRNIEEELVDKNVNIVDKEYILNNSNNFDLIMKAPGIAFVDINNEEVCKKINTQTSIFINTFRNQIIGVTGTKGKSTTSSLIYETLKQLSDNTIFCGNIGVPFFDLLDDINNETQIVCELSSHQLENINVSPKIAVITNIYPEHLDHYESYDKYIEAKMNIIKYQNEDDYCILNQDIDEIMKYKNDIKSNINTISYEKNEMFHVKHNKIYYNNKIIFDENDKRYLIGNHNLYNIAILFNVARIKLIDFQIVKKVVSEFKGLPHRLEYLGIYNDITFYNDSISTIPETCICALENIKNVETLIIGGLNRGISYKKLIDYLNSNLNIKVICMHDTGSIIYNEINNEKYLINDLEEAVRNAYEITDKNKVCLFSPAAASYGFYKNFEDRGNKFKTYVKKLENNNEKE